MPDTTCWSNELTQISQAFVSKTGTHAVTAWQRIRRLHLTVEGLRLPHHS